MRRRRPWGAVLLLALAAAAGGPAWGQAATAPVTGVAGVEAVRAELGRRARVPIVAELARPHGTGELDPAAVAAARRRLASELAPHGVAEVRGLGDLPFVALEVDAAQLDALLATGGVASVAPRRSASPH